MLRDPIYSTRPQDEQYSSLVPRKQLEVARRVKEKHAYVARDFDEQVCLLPPPLAPSNHSLVSSYIRVVCTWGRARQEGLWVFREIEESVWSGEVNSR
jgi:hypothetical protein